MTRRILLSYLTLTIFVLIVLEVPLGVTFARKDYNNVLVGVERDAWVLAAQSSDFLQTSPIDPAKQKKLQELATKYFHTPGGRVTIVDQQGMSVADGEPTAKIGESFLNRPEVHTAIVDGKPSIGSRESVTLNASLVYVAVPVISGSFRYGAIRITYPPDTLNQSILRNWITLGLVAIVSLIVAAIVGVVLAKSVTNPLSRVKTAAVAIGDGDLAARAPVGSGPYEVRTLAGAFNETAGRLQDLVVAQEAFVADASHQLRTPLTALRLRLETMEYDVDESVRDDLEGALNEVGRLSRLVDGLLTLARADRSKSGADETTDLLAHLHERQASWSALVAERGVEVIVTGDRAVAKIPPDHLTQIIDNLLANALEVMHPGQKVILCSELVSAEWAAVHVIDEGPGMTPAERSRAFDRFWRATNKPGELGGSGLGLAIVRRLARTSGGEAILNEAGTGGVDAVVRIPLVSLRK